MNRLKRALEKGQITREEFEIAKEFLIKLKKNSGLHQGNELMGRAHEIVSITYLSLEGMFCPPE